MSETEAPAEPWAIGGWLTLVAIGVVLSPLRLLYVFVPLYTEIFSSDVFSALTSPTSPAYHPLWQPVILAEAGLNGLITLAAFWLVYLMFAKKALFVKVYVGIAIVSTVFIVLDAYVVTLILPEEPMFDPETFKEFARSLVSLLVWSPYLLLSERSKATFIR